MTKSNFTFIKGRQNGFPIKAWDKGVHFDQNTYDQAANIAAMPFIHKHVALMPDAHLGIGATVGSVIATKGAVIPAAVGVDLGCLDAETEILTQNGWLKISEWEETKEDQILVFNPLTNESHFEFPLAYIQKEQDFFYHIKHTKGLDQMLCPNHKILFYKGFDKEERDYSIEISERFFSEHYALAKGKSGGFLATYGSFKGSLDWDETQARIHVMVSADCRVRGTHCELHIKKERKKNRAIMLLDKADIPYNLREESDGSVTISFSYNRKKGLSIFWNAGKETLNIVLEECVYWDGHDHPSGQTLFFSTNKDDADLIQHAFAANDIRATIYKTTYDKDNWKDCYTVRETKNKFVNMSPQTANPVKRVPSVDGNSYCFTTSTGFFVARRNNCIFVTGNCGMQAIKTSLKAEDLPDNLRDIRMDIERAIPLGFQTVQGRYTKGSWIIMPTSATTRMKALDDKLQLLMDKHPKLAKNKAHKQLGSLGGGNHFIEVCLDEDGYVWVMLHSGSRGVGNMIGRHFIEMAKKDMQKHFINLPDKDLSYFVEGSDHFDDYVEAVDWAQEYASENRNAMMDIILRILRIKLPPFKITQQAINCHHNYISRENHFGDNVIVTRKGAVSARKDELGIIPGSMGTGSFIVRGLGNADSFCSCSHGAGRVMSRTQAKKELTVDDHIKATEGIECRKDIGIIDESPAAYKDIGAVMGAQSDLVEIVAKLHQVINIKG